MKKQRPDEARMFFFFFFFLGDLGSNWSQQWGVRRMKKSTQQHTASGRELSAPHPFFELRTGQSWFGCHGDQPAAPDSLILCSKLST